MGFQHTDQDGDGVEIHKANAVNPQHHYVDATSHLGAYIPFEKTSELVASLYEDAGVLAPQSSVPVKPESIEQAEMLAGAYAREAVRLRGEQAMLERRRERATRRIESALVGQANPAIPIGELSKIATYIYETYEEAR